MITKDKQRKRDEKTHDELSPMEKRAREVESAAEKLSRGVFVKLRDSVAQSRRRNESDRFDVVKQKIYRPISPRGFTRQPHPDRLGPSTTKVDSALMSCPWQPVARWLAILVIICAGWLRPRGRDGVG